MLFLMKFCFPQEVKHCSVLLDRLRADDKAAKKEREEKEDMNRKGGKHTSRIPTFHKRPSSGNQNTESPVLRKDTPVHVTQPPQKAGSGSVEASKSKLPDVRETALHLPAIVSPKVNLEASSLFSSTEEGGAPSYSSQITAPKSWSLSGSEQLMTASPRPALRPEQGSEQHLPEQDKGKTSEVEPATIAVAAVSHLPHVDLLSQRPQEDTVEKYEFDTASGHTDKSDYEEIGNTTEVSHVDAIMDEEPPWVMEPMNMLELKDSRSSSDAESEENLPGEKSEGHDSDQVEDHHKSDISKLEFLNPTEEGDNMDEKPCCAAKKSTTAQSTKSTKVTFFTVHATDI